MKLKDVNEWEKKDAVVDQDNNVLCPNCKKRPAIITPYGMVRNCKKCGEIKVEGPFIAFVDANGFKSR